MAARYDRDASRYHPGVYKRKRADLVAVLDSTLSPLFLGQLKNLHKACLVQFKTEMHEGMRGENYNFAEIVAAARERCEAAFDAGAREAVPAPCILRASKTRVRAAKKHAAAGWRVQG